MRNRVVRRLLYGTRWREGDTNHASARVSCAALRGYLFRHMRFFPLLAPLHGVTTNAITKPLLAAGDLVLVVSERFLGNGAATAQVDFRMSIFQASHEIAWRSSDMMMIK